MTDEDSMRLAIYKVQGGIRSGQAPFGARIVKAERVVACEHNAAHDSCLDDLVSAPD